jgi:hypothetical protein
MFKTKINNSKKKTPKMSPFEVSQIRNVDFIRLVILYLGFMMVIEYRHFTINKYTG